MDAEQTLRRMRYLAAARAGGGRTQEGWGVMADELAELFEALDRHLSAGGTPPEAWREGPDAPELDGERPEGFTQCSCDPTIGHTHPCMLAVDPLGPPDPAGVDLPSAPHYWAMPDADAAAWR